MLLLGLGQGRLGGSVTTKAICQACNGLRVQWHNLCNNLSTPDSVPGEMRQCYTQNTWLHRPDRNSKAGEAGLGSWHSTRTSWRLVCPLMPASTLSCYATGWTESPEHLKTSIPLLPHIKHYGLFLQLPFGFFFLLLL